MLMKNREAASLITGCLDEGSFHSSLVASAPSTLVVATVLAVLHGAHDLELPGVVPGVLRVNAVRVAGAVLKGGRVAFHLLAVRHVEVFVALVHAITAVVELRIPRGEVHAGDRVADRAAS